MTSEKHTSARRECNTCIFSNTICAWFLFPFFHVGVHCTPQRRTNRVTWSSLSLLDEADSDHASWAKNDWPTWDAFRGDRGELRGTTRGVVDRLVVEGGRTTASTPVAAPSWMGTSLLWRGLFADKDDDSGAGLWVAFVCWPCACCCSCSVGVGSRIPSLQLLLGRVGVGSRIPSPLLLLLGRVGVGSRIPSLLLLLGRVGVGSRIPSLQLLLGRVGVGSRIPSPLLLISRASASRCSCCFSHAFASASAADLRAFRKGE